jgi:hypothetical protein
MVAAQYGEIGMGALYGDSLDWSGGAHCYLPSLKFYGGSVQSGTPAPEAPVDMYDHIGVYKVNGLQDYIGLPNLRSVGVKWDSLGIVRDEWDYVTGRGIRRIKKIVLDGEINKVTYASSKSGRIEVSEPILKGGNAAVASTHFVSQWNTNHGSIYALNDTMIYISMSGGLSVNDWNTWLAEQYANGTPVTVVYELAEPIEYDLADLPSVSTLYPATEITTSGDNIEVSYVADTKNYIDNKFNELATALVANS